MRSYSARMKLLMVFALAVGFAGCASAGGGSSRPEGATTNRIVMAELSPLGQIDALQAIQRLRPRWLQTRGGPTADPPVLYVDGAPRGSTNDLRFLRADEVEQMEYMSGSDATTRFGTGHQGGAILVTMR